ncbi:hypothetical protein [Novosphingobium cyanobacteriorum]|uniref:Cthe-2314-like HEPN domain-containing protein n=1 Tax=Novosphingobium cyanobacteriorum TaxID=3024215 RepID=A0ABT6CJT0_9SPHN|nr:hypothetical protein [Novosphingobium cyanobacteriorum]MDF8334051.1 hypothetical protein [Novosphingobium cyanobacteriorum]
MSAPQPDLLFHLYRSQCIDAFARSEAAIAAFLSRHNLFKQTEQCGQRLKKVRSIPASPRYSKASRVEMHLAIDEYEKLQSIRNDLVHAEMKLLQGSGAVACFTNPREQGGFGLMARLLTQSEIKALAGTALEIAVRIETAARPPQPKPAVPSA